MASLEPFPELLDPVSERAVVFCVIMTPYTNSIRTSLLGARQFLKDLDLILRSTTENKLNRLPTLDLQHAHSWPQTPTKTNYNN
jgi:hypothetical protein